MGHASLNSQRFKTFEQIQAQISSLSLSFPPKSHLSDSQVDELQRKMEPNLEQTLQEGKLYRQINALIVAYLRDYNLTQVHCLFLEKISANKIRIVSFSKL